MIKELGKDELGGDELGYDIIKIVARVVLSTDRWIY
jgi:hypothetical protein